MSFGRVVCRIFPVTLLALLLVNCSGSPSDSPVLTADQLRTLRALGYIQ